MRKRPSFVGAYLNSLGFSSRHVIDIGVADGTGWLYDGFQDATFYLIDPLMDETRVNTAIQTNACQTSKNKYLFHHCAVLDIECEAELTIYNVPGRSTFLKALPGDLPKGVGVEDKNVVSATTLDNFVKANVGTTNFGLKIDCEGTEGQVLSGGKEVLLNCEFLIVEMNINERFQNQQPFTSIIEMLDEVNLCFFNILPTTKHKGLGPTDFWQQSPKFYDFIFLNRDSHIFDPLNPTNPVKKAIIDAGIFLDSFHRSKDGAMVQSADVALSKLKSLCANLEQTEVFLPMMRLLAKKYYLLEEYEACLDLVMKTKKTYPWCAQVNSLGGAAARKINDFNTAACLYSDVCFVDPTNKDGLYGVAKANFLMENFYDAAIWYKRAIDLNVADVRFHQELKLCYEHIGESWRDFGVLWDI